MGEPILPVKPLVYIAGPYSTGDNVENVQQAVLVAEAIEARNCAVIIPHLSMLWHLIRPAPVKVWYRRDLEVLAHCNAVVRFPGPSTGADEEVRHARAQNIPVFFFDPVGMPSFDHWRRNWNT
jgi:hypothetical protein